MGSMDSQLAENMTLGWEREISNFPLKHSIKPNGGGGGGKKKKKLTTTE